MLRLALKGVSHKCHFARTRGLPQNGLSIPRVVRNNRTSPLTSVTCLKRVQLCEPTGPGGICEYEPVESGIATSDDERWRRHCTCDELRGIGASRQYCRAISSDGELDAICGWGLGGWTFACRHTRRCAAGTRHHAGISDHTDRCFDRRAWRLHPRARWESVVPGVKSNG